MALEQFFGRIVDMERVNDGDTLAVAALVGDSTLTVVDTADFDEDGGQLLFGGDVYDYDSVDHDTNTVSLVDTVSVAGAIDDPVAVFDTELGQVVVEYVAHVLMDDQDPDSAPVEVVVNHGLVTKVEESIRGGATESVTMLRDGDDDLIIWQIDGKLASDVLVDTAIAAADSAFDQALAALTEAQLALAISDGFVDIYYQTAAPWADGSSAHDDDTGDVWVDTDAATPTAYRWLNRTWTAIGDASILAALLAAQSAQTTADGKIRLYVGTTFPTLITNPELSYGDLLKRTDQDNKEYYWDGDSWEPLILGDDGIVSELVGKIITGAFIRTAASGERIEIGNFFGSPNIDFYSSGFGPAHISCTGGVLDLRAPGNIRFLQVADYGVSVGGPFSASTLSGPLTGDVTGDLYGDIYGGPTISGGLTVNGALDFNDLNGGGGPSFVLVGNSGALSRGVPYAVGVTDSGGVGFRALVIPN